MFSRLLLIRLSLFSAIVGIFALYFYSLASSAEVVKIKYVDSSFGGKYVCIDACVKSTFLRKRTLFLTLYDGAQIKAVVFKADYAKLFSFKNSCGLFCGKISIYKGRPEIIINRAELYD